MDKLLKLYTYVDGINDTPFPNESEQIIIGSFQYDANRMGGAPTITATVKHRLCLDDLWTDKVYATFRGEKYFVKNTPSSSKSNDDARYEHSVELLSEREILNHVYFIDAVQGDSSIDIYKSNSTTVVFFGDITEFVARLNASLSYFGLDYTVVIDEGITSEEKQVSITDKYFLSALQEIFNIYDLAYYFVGKTIHVGFTENAITFPMAYGADGALLSISKENANYQIINSITGVGSTDNIPYYYPNESDDRDAITSAGKKWITPQSNLMPPIYRESEGADMFYDAKNNTYQDPEGEYYEFENEYSEDNPQQGKVSFPEIKPTIKGMTNAAGQRIDTFIEFAYDRDDNEDFDPDNNNEYLHPYFFAKLRKTDGPNGFNLFDHAIENQPMQIAMTSGICGACTFEIGVGEETQKNIVQVDDNGKLKRDEKGNVIRSGEPQDRQNNTQTNEVWIALRKDDSTYAQLMPNKEYNYRPSANDTFVILGINLPQGYITRAEQELEDSLIKHMWMNNREKFNFSIKFSRIFFAEHPEVLEQLNENARLLIEYNNQQFTFYVDSFSYKMDSNIPLPEVSVDLVETLTVGQNSLQNALDSVKQDILSSIGGADFLKQGLKYFIRKDISDYVRGITTFLNGLRIQGKYISDVIMSPEQLKETDDVIMSVLKAVNTFIRKDKADATNFLLKLVGGAEFGNYEAGKSGGKVDAQGAAEFLSLLVRGLVTASGIESADFSTGALGTGFTLKIDENGDSYIEVDRMLVRKVATFVELLIQKIRAVGGQIILSPATMNCSRVEEHDTFYRCFFENTDGEKTIAQEFVEGDQARCQTFNVKEGVNENVTNTYYWRLVVGVGDDYIDLSKTDCDAGSTVPQAGDDIVQLGNRTDATRQAAIVLAAYGNDAPYFKMYRGIDSYSLSGKEFISFSRTEVMIIADSLRFSTGESVKDYIDDVVGSIEIGGRNLFKYSSLPDIINISDIGAASGNVSMGNHTASIDKINKYEGHNTLKIVATGAGEALSSRVFWQTWKNSDDGTGLNPKTGPYVLSFYAKAGKAGTKLYYRCGNNTAILGNITLTTSWARYEVKPAPVADWGGMAFWLSQADTVWMALPKVERGTNPTEWSPAPEDAENALNDYKEEVEAKFEATNESITAAVESSKSYTDEKGEHILSETTSMIEVAKGEINLSVDTKIDNLQIGGRNLYKRTKEVVLSDWLVNGGSANMYDITETVDGFTVFSGQNQWRGLYQNVSLEIGQSYVLSAYIKGDGKVKINSYADNCTITKRNFTQDGIASTEWKRYWFVFTVAGGASWRPRFENSVSGATIKLYGFKLERGTKATDWSPAPEDTDASITELSSRIEVTEESIKNTVSKTEFNELGDVVSNHTSQITQLNNQITSKVSSSELTEKLKGYVTTTTYNNKMSSIDQSLSSITSRVSSTETEINTIDGELQDITERVSAAELKITDDAIRATVESQTKQIADEAVKNLLIGGTNLVKGSATWNFANTSNGGTYIYSANADTSVPAGMVVQIKCTVGGSGSFAGIFSQPYINFVNGRKYTWSFYGRANKTRTISIVGFENAGQRVITFTTTRQRFTHTFTANRNSAISFILYNGWQSGDIVYIDSFKLEEGDKATDWDAHPDDAKVQGDNLLPGTKDFDGWRTVNSCVLDTSMMYQGLTPTKATSNYGYKGYDYTFVSGKFYTLSGWVRTNVANTVVVMFAGFTSAGQGHFTIPKANTWYRFVYCFKCGDADHAAGTKTVRLESGSSISSSRPLWVCGVKLEEGITPSPWTTALSEYSTTSEIKSSFEMTANGISLLGQEITLTGKVTFSMLASDVQGDLNKLDGLGDLAYEDKVEKAMLGTTVISGGYIQTDLIDVDNLYVKHLESADGVFTGSLQAATGSFSGEVTASSGKIGGWVISEHDLRSEDFVYPDFTQPSGGNGGGLVSGGNGSMMRTDGIIINSTENGVLPASSGSIMAALINASGNNAWVQGAYIGAHCSSTSGYLSQVVALELSATNAYSSTPMNTPIALKIANGFPDIPGVLLAGYVYSSGISSKYKYGKKRTTSGAYQSTYGYGGVKQYQIIHNLGHSNYVVLVTPVSIGASWRKYHAHIVSQGPSDFFVAFIDSGTEGTLVQSDFMFAMIGNNT